ncbi:MAG: PspC domain-containing protein [Acidimicrobiales bacterium]
MELTSEAPRTEVESRPLRRSHQGRLVAGVAAGLAQYLDFDVVLVRIVLVGIALMGGIGVPLYIAAWLLVPEEGADEAVAEALIDRLHAP